MPFSITYIHHNCFVLRTDRRAYLFDYPAEKYLRDGHETMVLEAVADTDLAVFISHSHLDHMNDDLSAATESAARVRYVLSDDVEEMRPSAVPVTGEVLIVEPDEQYTLGAMQIRTLMSNDLGVAYLVDDDGFRFYYGGDLAKWIWKTASSQAADFTTRFFRRAMDEVAAFSPHVAFSNVDMRVPDLAGGVEAYASCGAEVFVPMHTFGHSAWLDAFRKDLPDEGPQLFFYDRSGAIQHFHLT